MRLKKYKTNLIKTRRIEYDRGIIDWASLHRIS